MVAQILGGILDICKWRRFAAGQVDQTCVGFAPMTGDPWTNMYDLGFASITFCSVAASWTWIFTEHATDLWQHYFIDFCTLIWRWLCTSVGFTPCALNGLPTGMQAQNQIKKKWKSKTVPDAESWERWFVARKNSAVRGIACPHSHHLTHERCDCQSFFWKTVQRLQATMGNASGCNAVATSLVFEALQVFALPRSFFPTMFKQVRQMSRRIARSKKCSGVPLPVHFNTRRNSLMSFGQCQRLVVLATESRLGSHLFHPAQAGVVFGNRCPLTVGAGKRCAMYLRLCWCRIDTWWLAMMIAGKCDGIVGGVQLWVGLNGVVGSCCMLERVGACRPRGCLNNAGVWDHQLFRGVDVGRGHRCNRCDFFCGRHVYPSLYARESNIEGYLFVPLFCLEPAVVAYFFQMSLACLNSCFFSKIIPPKNINFNDWNRIEQHTQHSTHSRTWLRHFCQTN